MAKSSDERRDALTMLGSLAAAGVGGGALARGLLSLKDTVQDPAIDPLLHSSPVATPLPIPIRPGPASAKRRRPFALQAGPMPPLLAKAADQPVAPPATSPASTATTPPQADWLQNIASRVIPQGLPKENPLRSPWGIPVAALTGGAALGAGWHGMGYLAGKTKEDTTQTALTDAEEDYQKALAEQYRAAMRAKNAEDSLGIDELFDTYQTKKAEDPPRLVPLPEPFDTARGIAESPMLAGGTNMLNAWRGGVDLATIGAGLGTGYMTYNWVKNRNKQKLLEKAINLRARQRQFTPAPFYAVPETVDAAEPKRAP